MSYLSDFFTAYRNVVRGDNDSLDPKSLISLAGAECFDNTPSVPPGKPTNLDRFCALEKGEFGDPDLYPRTTYQAIQAGLGGNKGLIRLLVNVYDTRYHVGRDIADRIRQLIASPGQQSGTTTRPFQVPSLVIGDIQYHEGQPFQNDKRTWLLRDEYLFIIVFKELT